MAVSLSHYLDMGFPLWNPYHAYLQNQCLGNLLSFAASEVSITRRVALLHTIYLEIDENLSLALYQLHMPKFLEDINCYLYEINHIIVPQIEPTTSTASSSPLSPAALLAVEQAELAHEVQTNGTIHGTSINIPLLQSHSCFNKTCFKCHHLGHCCVDCCWYQCPICLLSCPGHLPKNCPLCHPIPGLSSSSSSSEAHQIPSPPPKLIKFLLPISLSLICVPPISLPLTIGEPEGTSVPPLLLITLIHLTSPFHMTMMMFGMTLPITMSMHLLATPTRISDFLCLSSILLQCFKSSREVILWFTLFTYKEHFIPLSSSFNHFVLQYSPFFSHLVSMITRVYFYVIPSHSINSLYLLNLIPWCSTTF